MGIPPRSQMIAKFNKLRTQSGNTFTPTGSSTALACSTGQIGVDDPQFVPDGNRNAAEADYRVFSFAPIDGRGVVVETSEGVWNGNGAVYVITSAQLNSWATSWRCTAYRKPVPGTSAANPTGSNGSW